jgi:hypothetical protein
MVGTLASTWSSTTGVLRRSRVAGPAAPTTSSWRSATRWSTAGPFAGGRTVSSACAPQWLPYYSDKLRAPRLADALKYARNDLDHIPPYAERGLSFQCLKRLHHAVEETLQALFIAARIYPIAYDKWVEEQVSEILGRPDLYATLVQVVTIPDLSAPVLTERAAQLSGVLDGIASGEPGT